MSKPVVDIASNECRYVIDAMPTPDVAAVTDQTVIENSATINIFRFLQPIKKIGKQLGLLKFPLEVCLYVGLRSAPVAQFMGVCGETNRF